jgi:hypothetical protein
MKSLQNNHFAAAQHVNGAASQTTSTLDWKRQTGIAVTLAMVMALTRFHHFGSSISLPDASYAVFFLAGIYLRSRWAWLGFFVEAAVIDYVAIHYGGVSGWCVTPAYAFLIPGYAALWLAGRWSLERRAQTWRSAPLFILAATVGIILSFIISNIGFYLFSGYFETTSWTAFSVHVSQYLPPYLYSTYEYLAAAVAIHLFVAHCAAPYIAKVANARPAR